jgi:hypothetical protein
MNYFNYYSNCFCKPGRFLLVSVFTLTILGGSAKAQNFAWAKQFGGANVSTGCPMGTVRLDAAGNIYQSLTFTGTVDVDPGPAVVNVASDGSGYVVKLDPSGNFLWGRAIRGNITVDNAGNVYSTGSFNGTKDFDPGPSVYNLTSFGYDDVFILKFDPSGNFVWAKQVGGTFMESSGFIAISPMGRIYVTGGFGYGGNISPINSCDFDPDPNTTYNLTNVGQRDGFVLCLDLNGQFISVLQKGTSLQESVSYVSVDANGDVLYIYGNGNHHLEKIDANNNILWSVNLGTTALQLAPISVDPSGNVLVSGGYNGTVDFDPGPGTATFTSSTIQDPFAEKFDRNGNFMWARVIKANGFANGIVSDAGGNVYSTGYFNSNSSVDFDPGPGTYNLKTSGIAMHVQKLTPSGNFVWAVKIGGVNKTTTRGRAIVINSAYDVITGFDFSGSIDVNPGDGTTTLKAKGSQDVVLHKMTQPNTAPSNRVKPYGDNKYLSAAAHPNPNNGSFSIDVPVLGKNALIRIYDGRGSVVYSKSLDGTYQQRIQVDLTNKPNGIYFIEISGSDQKKLTTKFVVSR